MQIGAANLLALQQQPQANKPSAPSADFAKALSETPPAENFEPLFGKPPAAPVGQAATDTAPTPIPAPPSRPGSQIDIKI
ncbi:MAG TPA: hypothetical protein VHW02_05475 [Rhizomicrobium sp.]|jgi:hypothetical protein|nr:hypothetical protein [Rhizomicrobium sp.]